MSHVSSAGWAWFIAIFLLSSWSGILLSRLMVWSDQSRLARVPEAFGLAFAPFVTGVLTVIALGVFPGGTHRLHLLFITSCLLILFFLGFLFRRSEGLGRVGKSVKSGSGMLWMLMFIILFGWIIYFAVDLLAMPLLQNDALEYASAARVLFETRDIADYPVVNPQRSSSGFYGPWTHPPLYTALLYLAYLLQDHANYPGLLRLISPWFFISSVILLHAVCSILGRLQAGWATIVYLATPLAVMGASSGLIDALSMCGLLMVVTCVAHLDQRPVARPLQLGIIVGLSLWAHSQAILVIPLVLVAVALVDKRSSISEFFLRNLVLVLGIVMVAGWPYFRNLIMFGSLVSDNPAVFALPELNWPEYFSKARGLESFSEKVQYGIFKGWTILRSYGFAFWFMTLGVFLTSYAVPKKIWLNSFLGKGISSQYRLQCTALVFIICYFSGVVLSTFLGIDLMIKNDRYLLFILPCVVIFSGIFLGKFLSSGNWVSDKDNNFSRAIQDISVMLIAGVLVIQLCISIIYQQHRNSVLGVTVFEQTDPDKLRYWPGYSAMSYLRESTPPDSLILAERPSEMYYAHRKMISYLDDRLIPVYREADILKAVSALRGIGVTHIQMPGYSHPAIYNTLIQKIIADYSLTSLVFSNGSEQIYSLESSRKKIQQIYDLSPGVIPWSQIKNFSLLGIRQADISIETDVNNSEFYSVGGMALPLFQRAWTTVLISGSAKSHVEQQDIQDMIAVDSGKEYIVDLDVEGDAYVHVYLHQYDRSGRLLGRGRPSNELISEMVLDPASGPRSISRRVVMSPDTEYVRLSIEHRGNSIVRIKSVKIKELVYIRD